MNDELYFYKELIFCRVVIQVFFAKDLWYKLSYDSRIKLLSYFDFKADLSYSKYEVLPEDLKSKIRSHIEKNDRILDFILFS